MNAGPWFLGLVGVMAIVTVVALVVAELRARRNLRAFYRELAETRARHAKLFRRPER